MGGDQHFWSPFLVFFASLQKCLIMSDLRKIGVFCSASSNVKGVYMTVAKEVGEYIGSNGCELVYGGSAMGMMEVVAKAVKENGGKVTGVVPQVLMDKGVASEYIGHLIVCKDLTDRKSIMLENSDIMIALPGGVGTLDEVFTVMAGVTLGYHKKRIIFYNTDDFWTPLTDYLKTLYKEHFIRNQPHQLYDVANNLDELAIILNR